MLFRSDEAGEVAVDDGILRVVAASELATVVASRPIGTNAIVVRLDADLVFAGGTGAIGLGCVEGDGATPSIVGWVGTDDRWRLERISAGAVRTLAEGSSPAGRDLSGGGGVRLSLECAVTGSPDGERAAFWVDGLLVADRLTGVTGDRWTRVAIVARADAPPLLALADEATTMVGDGYAPVTLDPAVEALLRTIPDDWRQIGRAHV